MFSWILRIGMVVAALYAMGAVAQGRGASAETQVAQAPFWAQPYLRKYRKQPHFRALACARAGRGEGDHCFEVSGAPMARAAVDRVMEMCKTETRRRAIFAPCRVLFIGDIDVSRMNGSQLDRAIDKYQVAAGPPGLWPGFTPGPVKGVDGVSMRKLTFTTGVTDYTPKDDLRTVSFSDGGFYIHLRWALNLAVVKRLIVRYEVFDAAGRLVANRTNIFKPTVANWSTWHWIDIFKVTKPGKWKVSVYVSTGPGEVKVGETYLTVARGTTQRPPEPAPSNANMRMFCAVSENGRRFNIYIENRNSGDRTCRASCSYADRGQEGVLECSGAVPAGAKRMVLCTRYGRQANFAYAGKRPLTDTLWHVR